jgi:hypothetical protein
MDHWIVQAYRDGQEHGQPLEPIEYADEAIMAANGLLGDEAVHEVVVFHKLCPDKANLKLNKPIPDDKIIELGRALEDKADEENGTAGGRFNLSNAMNGMNLTKNIVDLMDSPMMRSIRTIQALANPLGLNALGEAEKIGRTLSGHTTQQDLMHGMLGHANTISRVGAPFGQTLADLIGPGFLGEALGRLSEAQTLSESITGAGRAARESNTSETFQVTSKFAEGVLKSVELANSFAEGILSSAMHTNSFIATVLESAELFQAAEAVRLTSAAIAPLANSLFTNVVTAGFWPSLEFAQAHREHALELIELSGLCGQPSLVEVPATLACELALETYRTLDLDQTFSGQDDSEDLETREALSASVRGELDARILELEPSFIQMLQGARSSLKTSNEDMARHVCVSLRELLGHVLRMVAPDEKVMSWSSLPGHFHDGRPTRTARLDCLLDTSGCSLLKRYLRLALKSVIEVIDQLNAPTHTPQSPLTRHHLEVLLCKVEGDLNLILKIASGGKG